jgi:ankyrin repeat protein
LFGSRDVVKILLKAGANKDQACKLLGWSHLVWEVAVQDSGSLSNYMRVINVLEEKHNIQLAAEIAVKLNRPDALQLLIDAQADVNHIYDCNRTLVYFAADKGHEKCLQLLIAADAEINIIEDKLQGQNDALTRAWRNGNYSCVDILLNTPTLTMAAINEDPFFFRLHKASVVCRTIDTYQEDKEYNKRIKEQFVALKEQQKGNCTLRC